LTKVECGKLGFLELFEKKEREGQTERERERERERGKNMVDVENEITGWLLFEWRGLEVDE
jgi:hypothetical protein